MWESVVKHQLGKLHFRQSPAVYLPLQRERHHISSLPLDEMSVAHLPDLPLLHRDPFDRMLVCQALAYDLTLVTVDDAIFQYSVKTLETR